MNRVMRTARALIIRLALCVLFIPTPQHAAAQQTRRTTTPPPTPLLHPQDPPPPAQRQSVLPPGAVVAPRPLDANTFIGTLSDSTYANNFFGFTLKAPEGWLIKQPDETVRKVITEGTQKMGEGLESKFKAAADAAVQRTTILLITAPQPATASQPGSASPDGFSPFVLCVVEDISPIPDIFSGRDFHDRMKRDIERAGVPIVVGEIVSTTRIGGRELTVYENTVTEGERSAKQEFYVTVVKGYAVCFALTYRTEEQHKALRQVLTNIKFAA